MKRFLARVAAAELPWVAALAFLATWGFFCEYLPPMGKVHIYSDIEGYHFPLQRYAFQSLKEGRFPQWDPSMYCGVSFIGNLQAAVLYPPSWLMYAASWRRSRIKFKMLEDFVFVHIWLAYLLCYMWLRGRAGPLAAAMGAGVFAFGGYMASQCVHVGVVTGLTWMPLGLWGIDQATRRREDAASLPAGAMPRTDDTASRTDETESSGHQVAPKGTGEISRGDQAASHGDSAPVGGAAKRPHHAPPRFHWRPLWKTAVAAALCFLAGYPPTWIVFATTCSVYALEGAGRWRALLGVCGALAASILLAMAQWLPTLSASSGAAFTAKYGAGINSWRALIPYFIPNWFDGNRGATSDYPLDAIYLYVGLPALFAIGWAVSKGVRGGVWRPYVQPLAVGAVCLAIATNPGWLVYDVISRVPVLERSVQSYNFYEGVAAMAALVTALGLESFLAAARASTRKAPTRWLMPAAAVALAGWTVRLLWIWGHGGQFAAGAGSLAETAIAIGLFSAAMLALRRETGWRRACLAAALILLAWSDYKVFGTNRRFNTVEGDVDKQQIPVGIHGMNLTAYWELWNNRQFRVASDERGGPNATDYRMWGLATPLGFDPFLPLVYHQFIERWVPFDTNREFRMAIRNQEMMRELGVRYVITHEGAVNAVWLAASPLFRLVGRDDSFYRVYEFLQARAPYGWVDGAEADGGNSGRPTGWLPERRVFQVDSSQGGRFFLAEQDLPGWSASVDGRPAAVERWNSVFQAVAVGPGPHRVVFEYHAGGLLPGAAIGIGTAIALALAVRGQPARGGSG